MAEHCSIFSPEADFSKVIAVSGSDPRFRVCQQDALHITLKFESYTLHFNGKLRLERGDEVSKILLGAYAFFDSISNADPARESQVCKTILRTNMIVGIVAEPEFDVEESMYELVTEVARDLNGFIFAGDALLDSDDRLLLDSSGAFDP